MNVISEKRTYSDGHRRTEFELHTDTEPTPDEVVESQIRCGYNPAGYGGPFGIKTTKNPDGTFKTVWGCWGSCD